MSINNRIFALLSLLLMQSSMAYAATASSVAGAANKGPFFLAIWAVMVIPLVVSVILVGAGRRLYWFGLGVLVCGLSGFILLSGVGGFLHFFGFALPILLIPFAYSVNRIASRLSLNTSMQQGEREHD